MSKYYDLNGTFSAVKIIAKKRKTTYKAEKLLVLLLAIKARDRYAIGKVVCESIN